MKGVSVFIFVGLWASWGGAQFLNHRPFPTYSLENMPDTEFSCRDKILGGYYADVDTQCQMFHICVKVAGVGVQDFRFLCPNGTAFDQDHQICAEWEDVDCDVSTLYYSSDNFDLYRIGSGFESKAVKYGEDEETFALQRAETGDARLNREHQTQRVNQQKQQAQLRKNKNSNNDRDIFKGSSSSNFFNNRNSGKDTDEDYDDNVNTNQDNDRVQKKKLIRKQQNRRPVQQQQQNSDQNNEQRPINRNSRPRQHQQNNDYQNQNNRPQNRQQQQQNNDYQNTNTRPQNNDHRQQGNNRQNDDAQTVRPNRPTGFVNNFAGSSYVPTTSRPTTTSTTQRQYNNADNFRQNQNSAPPTYPVSTPAPFRQTQQYNNPPSRPANNRPVTTLSPQKETENYPTNFPKQPNNKPDNYQPTTLRYNQKQPTQGPINNQYSTHYDVPKVKPTENHPTNAPRNPTPNQYNNQYEVSKIKPSTQFNNNQKKPTTPFNKQDNYPTTFAPKFFKTAQGSQYNNQPSTFSPRNNPGYTPISQQTTQYNTQNQNNYNQHSTPKTTPFTQYTPTVPKITPTTPVARSNRFDETQYDDGSYNPNYDRRSDDEFLKTAHSQNIASSRNEYVKNAKTSTQKPHYESPRPFSVSPNTPKAVDYPKSTQQPPQQIKTTKKTKDVSYDYAYYDTNVGSEPEYEIETEIKKSSVKN